MSGSVLVILVLAAVMAAIVAVSVFILRRVGDRAERRADVLRGEVERLGEEWVIPLAGAVYRGGAHPAGRSKGHGVLGLTDRRVVFLPIAGEQLSVPRVRIAGARLEERAAATSPAAHRHHLVLRLDDDSEVGFLVDDAREWAERVGGAGRRVSEVRGGVAGYRAVRAGGRGHSLRPRPPVVPRGAGRFRPPAPRLELTSGCTQSLRTRRRPAPGVPWRPAHGWSQTR